MFDNEAEGRSESAMVWLARYASKAWCLLTLVLPSSTASTPAPGDAITQDKSEAMTLGQWICLLCEKKTFSVRSSLTRHFKVKHIDGGTLNHPFQCPQCRRDGHPPHTISSVTEWSNHVELTHGILYTPVVKPDRKSVV